ncbi:MAG TPA: integron integrase [Longimicrobiales bacterium]|nr:integron integrase [Longimicrobiales bacterium]
MRSPVAGPDRPPWRPSATRPRAESATSARPESTPPAGPESAPEAHPCPRSPEAPAQLIERVRRRIRARHLSPRTEETSVGGIRRYLDFHGRLHPAALGRIELERFATHLTEHEGLGAQSVNQAASAVAFMYRELFGQEMGRRRAVRAKQPKVLPKYATPEEVARVFAHLGRLPLTAAMLMYGSGTRIAETLAIRIQDLSLDTRELHVRGGKGAKDRTTVIASAAIPILRERIAAVAEQHARDRAQGGGWAPLPGALHRKDPRAGWDLGWQYLFPASKPSIDEKTGRRGRRPLHATVVQVAVKRAVKAANVARPITCHVLRHCFATELVRNGCDIKLLQRLMGHRDLRTTSLYLHILDRPGIAVVSPLDRLPSWEGQEATDEST